MSTPTPADPETVIYEKTKTPSQTLRLLQWGNGDLLVELERDGQRQWLTPSDLDELAAKIRDARSAFTAVRSSPRNTTR